VCLLDGKCFVLPHQRGTCLSLLATSYLSLRISWAVRANRQLSIEVQLQGMNEEAARFAYRAQVLQRHVLWFQVLQSEAKLRQRGQALGGWLFSWFLFLLAGYGYKPARSFLAVV